MLSPVSVLPPPVPGKSRSFPVSSLPLWACPLLSLYKSPVITLPPQTVTVLPQLLAEEFLWCLLVHPELPWTPRVSSCDLVPRPPVFLCETTMMSCGFSAGAWGKERWAQTSPVTLRKSGKSRLRSHPSHALRVLLLLPSEHVCLAHTPHAGPPGQVTVRHAEENP